MTDPGYFELSIDDHDLLTDVPVCGCGNPEQLYDLYRTVLRATPTPGSDDYRYGPAERAPDLDPLLWEVVNGVLDDIRATEHGGNIWGCWLTKRGERLLAILDDYAQNYDRIPCGEQP